MELSENFFEFVHVNRNEDCSKLRLKSYSDADFDTKFAIDQIEARRKTRNKLPSFNSNPKFLYPSLLAAEQSTSEDVAMFKRTLFDGKYSSVCDLTGGLGIDTAYISDVVEKVTYVERYTDYCNVARHNFSVLGKNNIEVVNADCREFVESGNMDFDAFYIDPARRGVSNLKLYSFADCEPDILSLLPILMRYSSEVWIKASPMMDISLAVSELKNVSEVFAISVRNECKELLFHVVNGYSAEPSVHCVRIYNEKRFIFDFLFSEEKEITDTVYATAPLSYLYEPDTSILKGGAFKCLARRFGLSKLHVSSHIYTGDSFMDDFPGRKFEVLECIPFKGGNLKKVAESYPAANITVRNFPLSSDALRKKLKIKDGGDLYLFATKCGNDRNVLIVCRKATV